ncbi:type I-E CRISPR-associated endoribonuclease Cas2e [Anaerococcus degeneri]|uniref:Type I-E CRISPR-associated endoribonuclease Cas2e n=2 Tax=Anaerococcus TaxID=165779 RepID=A0ABS7Z2A4_9FIRM|nr:type I-E CRISPR-associated endoribonuclease Cas2e [Anaerococcus degeneri]MBP2016149.1 CRISPR-associated protein Cas2 [Anaerococcus degeneri]MCA2096646.1 type I-E CRISPR-associated endoribonuclease Cas2e [Anaerococcus degeneri]
MAYLIERFKMPLTVITLKNSPPSLRGDLTKWMQEISTGVYVGNFNTKIREELRDRVVESVGSGEATMTYAYRNEIGYKFETHNSNKISIDFDGIPLVFTPNNPKENKKENKLGFSKTAKMRKAKKYSRLKSQEKTKAYVIIDLETTGLDPINDRIIEIGAIRIGKEIKEYSTIMGQEMKIPEKIRDLTGISEEDIKKGKDEKRAINELLHFIGEDTLVGYNINFDIKFINEALKRQEKPKVKNMTYDVMKYVKNDKLFLKNYKLETVVKEYGINEKVPHRALEDARITQKLIGKLEKLTKRLENQSE